MTWQIDNKYYTADVHFCIEPLPLSFASVKQLKGTIVPESNAATRASRNDNPSSTPANTALELGCQDVSAVILSLAQLETQEYGPYSKALWLLKETLRDALHAEDLDIAIAVHTVDRAGAPTDSQHYLQDATGHFATVDSTADHSRFEEDGWETVLLCDTSSVTGGSTTSNDAFDDEDEGNEEPIERIRNALMAHMWPSLQRKSDRVASLVGRCSPAPHPPQSASSNKEQLSVSQDYAAPSLPLDFDLLLQGAPPSDEGTQDLDSFVPSAEDLALAQKFLSRIREAELSMGHMGEVSASERQTEAQRALEAFLEEEDPSWPTALSNAHASSTRQAEFEDDFGDFTEAEQSSEGQEPSMISIDGLAQQAQLIREMQDKDAREKAAARVADQFASLILQ